MQHLSALSGLLLVLMPSVIFLIMILLDSSLTVKAATLIFISGCGSAV